MVATIQSAREVVRSLSKIEQAELAQGILQDLDAAEPETSARDSAWVEIAESRDRAIDADPSQGLDGDEILGKLERGECP